MRLPMRAGLRGLRGFGHRMHAPRYEGPLRRLRRGLQRRDSPLRPSHSRALLVCERLSLRTNGLWRDVFCSLERLPKLRRLRAAVHGRQDLSVRGVRLPGRADAVRRYLRRSADGLDALRRLVQRVQRRKNVPGRFVRVSRGHGALRGNVRRRDGNGREQLRGMRDQLREAASRQRDWPFVPERSLFVPLRGRLRGVREHGRGMPHQPGNDDRLRSVRSEMRRRDARLPGDGQRRILLHDRLRRRRGQLLGNVRVAVE